MNTERRSNMVVGVVLVLVGVWFLLGTYFPELADLIPVEFDWPVLIIGIGLIFFVSSALVKAPGLAVPGAILAGIGSILYYQNQTGDWDSWAYAWTLIPGFVGLGILISNFFEGRFIRGFKEGFGMIFFSLIMFAIFGSFLGGPAILGEYWPLLLVLAGLWMVGKGLIKPRGSSSKVETDMSGDEDMEVL